MRTLTFSILATGLLVSLMFRAREGESARVSPPSSPRASQLQEESPESLGRSASSRLPRDVVAPQAVLKIIESVNVPAQQSGILREVQVREGDVVTAGQPLAKIDAAQAALRVEEAEIELKMAKRQATDDINIRFAKKSLEVAQAELKRSRELNSGKYTLVTQTEIERQELIVEKNRLEIERAELELESAEDQVDLKSNVLAQREDLLQRYEILAPIDGMVVSVERRSGEWIQEAETVVRVVRIDRLRVEGFVDAAEAAAGLVGRPVRLELIGEGEQQRATGEVVFVNPEAITVANRAKIRVWAEVENEDLRLFPGQQGKLTILATDDR